MNVLATRIASADDVYSRHDCKSRSFRSTPPEFFDPCAQCQILVCTSWTEVHDAVAAPRLAACVGDNCGLRRSRRVSDYPSRMVSERAVDDERLDR